MSESICQDCGAVVPSHNLSPNGFCADCLGVSRNGSKPEPVLEGAALYGLPGKVVETLDPHTEAAPAAQLIDFLVSFGSAVGPGPHAIADGSEHPARLNAIIVGTSSRARKGTSRRRIGNLFDAVDEVWARERVMGGLASGEGLIAAVAERGEGPSDPRLMIVEEEISRTLAVAAREGATLSPIIRQAWDHGNLRVMTRNQPLKVSGAHISVLAHSTVEDIRRRLTDTDVMNGFANRFLFVLVRRGRVLPEGGAVPEGLNSLIRLIRNRVDDARKVSTLKRSPEAVDLWDKIYRKIARDEVDGLFGAATARADAQTLRLSVAYALTDGSSTIEVDHLKAAWALWRYCEDSARFLFGDKRGDQVEDRLLVAIREAGSKGLDGAAQHQLFSGHITAERLGLAREALESAGQIRTETTPTAGRPREVSFYLGREESE